MMYNVVNLRMYLVIMEGYIILRLLAKIINLLLLLLYNSVSGYNFNKDFGDKKDAMDAIDGEDGYSLLLIAIDDYLEIEKC